MSVREHIESCESFVVQEWWWPDSRRVTGVDIKNRGRYDRSALRYPSDLTDEICGASPPLGCRAVERTIACGHYPSDVAFAIS